MDALSGSTPRPREMNVRSRWKAASGFPLRLRFDASSVVWLEYGSQAFILDGRTAMANAVTVGELVESYIKHIARKGMRTAPVIACALRRDVVPRLPAGRAATEVTSLELRDVLEQIEARAPSAAVRALVATRGMYTYGIRTGCVEENPLSNVRAPSRKMRVRDYHLSVGELRRVIPELAKEPYSVAAALLMILISACRTGDFLGLRRENIRPERGGYLVLGEDPRRQLLVPVTPLMRALIDRQIALQPGAPFLFPGAKPTMPAASGKLLERWKAAETRAGVAKPIPIRDLRRTAVLIMAELGVEYSVLENLLGRASAGLHAKWRLLNRTHLEGRRAALEKLEAALLSHPEVKAALDAILAKTE
jgi:integrase